jgi:hypothetical protein
LDLADVTPHPFAARSTPQTPFDHKIHHQIQFFKKFQPRFHFHCQKTAFTGREPRKTDSRTWPVMAALNTRPPTFHYCNDPGILSWTGNTGKGGSNCSQRKMQCFDS